MANFYIDLAIKILTVADRPLTAREIIDHAKAHGMLPEPYAKARTPHRTVHARMAESIRREGERSPYYRFGPGRFGLRAKLADPTYQYQYKSEYKAPIRKKEISTESVLCIPRTAFPLDDRDGFFPPEAVREYIISSSDLMYVPRRRAERSTMWKQIVTYVAVIREGRVLCYERGAYAAVGAELLGLKSIGFGGHVAQQDHDLFSSDPYGIVSNARRELFEELRLVGASEPLLLGLINDNTTAEGQKHLAIAMLYNCESDVDPAKGELDIRNLHWKSAKALPNDLQSFEVWSQALYRQVVIALGPA